MTENENWSSFFHNAPDKFFSNSNLLLKTLSPPDDCTLTGTSKQIWDVFETIKQTDLEFTNKINLWRRLNKTIKSKFPEHGLYIAGSTLNGFGLISSDVDFSFLPKHPFSVEILDRDSAITNLKSLLKCLQASESINRIQLIDASVPLINFNDKLYNLDVDINCNATANIRNTHLLYRYSQVDWRVKPLVIVIKLWAKIHNVIDAKYGSLSSYPLVLMVIHFLQCGVKPVILPNLQSSCEEKFKDNCDIESINFFEKINIPFTSLYPCNKQSLEELLLAFFKYYTDFEFKKYVISVREGTKVPTREYLLKEVDKSNLYMLTYTGWRLMYIEEPFNLSNVARTVHKLEVFERIVNRFRTSYQNLKESNELLAIFK